MQIYAEQTQLVLDLVGVFFFAVTGALLAARKGFDVVASVLLAGMTGFRGTLLLFDAAGLGLFCVTGTVKALDVGVPAVVLGVTSAVGGGLLRDVVAREVPSLFHYDDIYALPAVVGAAVTAVVWRLDALSVWTGVAASVPTFVLRELAVRNGWRTHWPTAACTLPNDHHEIGCRTMLAGPGRAWPDR